MVKVVNAAAVNTARWEDPPTDLVLGQQYTLSVRASNPGRPWSAAKTLPFVINAAPAFSDFRVDGSTDTTAWRTTPLLSAKASDRLFRLVASATVEVFDEEPTREATEGPRPVGGGPGVLIDGVVSWRPPPGLLADKTRYWVRFTATDQQTAIGSEVYTFSVDARPATIAKDAVSVSPVTSDGQVSALEPVVSARVTGESAELVLRVQVGGETWSSVPVTAGSVAQVRIPAEVLSWGGTLSGEVQAVTACEPTVEGPWTPVTWPIAAEPRVGEVVVTPRAGGEVTSDRPVLSAPMTGVARDLGASFTVTVGSRTLRSVWVPVDRGQVSWQVPEALPAGEVVEWVVQGSYRLGGSGHRETGQFTTSQRLFGPSGLAVTPRSLAGLVSSARPTFSAWIGGLPGEPAQVVFRVNGRDSDPVAALTGTRVEGRAGEDLSGDVTWSVTATVDGQSLTTAGAGFRVDLGAVCAPDQGGRR